MVAIDRHSDACMVLAVGVAGGLGSSGAYIYGLMGTTLRDGLGIDHVQLGLLSGAYFAGACLSGVLARALVSGLPGASMVRAHGVFMVIGYAIPLVADKYPAFLAGSILIGAGYPMLNAGLNHCTAVALPQLRERLMIVKTAAVPVTAVLLAVVIPGLGAQVGWRPVLVVCLCLGAGVACAPMGLGRVPLLVGDADFAPGPDGLNRRGPVAVSIGAFWAIGGSQALFSWLAPHLQEQSGSVLASSVGFGCVVLAASALMVVFGRLMRAHFGQPLIVVWGLCAVSITALAAFPASFVVTLVISSVAMGAQLAGVALLHSELIYEHRTHVGAPTMTMMVGYCLGGAFGPTAFGVWVEFVDYNAAWLASGVMTLASLPAFAFALISCQRSPIQPEKRGEQ